MGGDGHWYGHEEARANMDKWKAETAKQRTGYWPNNHHYAEKWENSANFQWLPAHKNKRVHFTVGGGSRVQRVRVVCECAGQGKGGRAVRLFSSLPSPPTSVCSR